jgi:phosphoribosylglycinamide formyltransferase-1
MKNIAVFASGTGSNFLAINEAIKNGELDANLVLLVSDKPYCKAVENANIIGIKTFVFEPKTYRYKSDYEKEILKLLKELNIALIILAGYMRLIGDTLLKEYPHRILNIHPSLLPLYKGKDAIGQALKDNAVQTGVTVHYVDEGMDTGRVIAQEETYILDNEERHTLEKRVHEIEHKLYPEVIQKVLEEL